MGVIFWVSILYHANPKVSQNPNFYIGCFELILSKIFATASKMGKKYFIFAIFLRNPFLPKALHQKKNAFFWRFRDWD